MVGMELADGAGIIGILVIMAQTYHIVMDHEEEVNIIITETIEIEIKLILTEKALEVTETLI
mgnify:CR=1 FL=1